MLTRIERALIAFLIGLLVAASVVLLSAAHAAQRRVSEQVDEAVARIQRGVDEAAQ